MPGVVCIVDHVKIILGVLPLQQGPRRLYTNPYRFQGVMLTAEHQQYM